MAAVTAPRDFFELVKAIGESKSKQEEDRIVTDEASSVHNIAIIFHYSCLRWDISKRQ